MNYRIGTVTCAVLLFLPFMSRNAQAAESTASVGHAALAPLGVLRLQRGDCASMLAWRAGDAGPNLLYLGIGEHACPVPKGLYHVTCQQLSRLPSAQSIYMHGLPWHRDELRECLDRMSKLEQLEKLGISNMTFDAGTLAPLSRFGALRDLSLSGDPWPEEEPGMGDWVFDLLIRMPELRVITLSRSKQITGRGIDQLRHMRKLTHLTLEATAVGDVWLPAIAAIGSLESLNVCDTKVSSAGLAHLAKAPALRSIAISFMSKDAALALRQCQQLREMEVHLYGLTEEATNGLAQLSSLRSLTILTTKWDRASLGRFAPELRQLERLAVIGRLADDSGDGALEELRAWRTLQSLTMNPLHRITPQGWSHLTRIATLEELSLGGTVTSKFVDGHQVLEFEWTFDGNTVTELSRLNRLRSLSLQHIRFDRDGWKAIGQLSGLRQLSLRNFESDDKSLEPLAQLGLLEELAIDHKPTVDALAYFRTLKHLRVLDLTGSGITDLEVQQLTQVLAPGVTIRYGE